jgi:hypothetical protein
MNMHMLELDTPGVKYGVVNASAGVFGMFCLKLIQRPIRLTEYSPKG